MEFAEYDGTDWVQFGVGTDRLVRANKWYTVRFEVSSGTLRLYIDDRLILVGEASQPLVCDKGGIGYYMGGGEEIHLDDIRVWSLP